MRTCARFPTVSPRARAKPVKVELVKVSPATEQAIREGLQAIQRGETHELTRAELDRWAETGEWPAWLDEPPTSRT
jgi:hypothetical protein